MTTDRRDPDDTPELDDEFWGEQTEWVPHPARTSERAGLGATVARWWDGLLGGGVASERAHGRVTTSPIDPDRHADTPTIVDESPGDRFRDQADNGRDDDEAWTVEPEPRLNSRPGVDPLIARLGGLAVIVTLAAPLVLGFTSSGADSESGGALQATISTAPTAELVEPSATTTGDQQAASATTGQPASSASTPAASPSSPAVVGNGDDVEIEATAPSSTSGATAALQDSSEPEPAATEPPVTAPACGSRYELAAGDYWIRIADAANVSLADLLAVNDSSVDTVLVPGRSICLPAGASTPAPPSTAAPAPAPTSPSNTVAPNRRPATTVAPSPTTTAPSRPAAVSQSQSAQIIRNVWPDELEERALEIAWRESNHRSNVNNWCCYGLFQIHWNAHRSWLATIGITSVTQLFDPTLNATAAYTLYQRAGGWGPWGG